MACCSLLRLPAVYYVYLHVVYYGYPAVYYGYLKSTMTTPVVSLHYCLVFYTQLLYYAYLIFIITTSELLSLHYLLSLPTYAIVCCACA